MPIIKYRTLAEKKEAQRLRKAKYDKSTKGKAAKKRYSQSKKGKLTHKKSRIKRKNKLLAYQRKWRRTPKGKLSVEKYNRSEKKYIYTKKYRKTIKGKIVTKKSRQKSWKKTKKDPTKYLISQMRKGIYKALKKRQEIKLSRTLNLLGCSAQKLRSHLEKRFKPGMNWSNYGINGWHVDHIVPIDFFNLKNLKEQKKCFNYKNLQPLWAKENIIKSNKII